MFLWRGGFLSARAAEGFRLLEKSGGWGEGEGLFAVHLSDGAALTCPFSMRSPASAHSLPPTHSLYLPRPARRRPRIGALSFFGHPV